MIVRKSRLRVGLIGAVALAAAVLSGCGASGPSAPTGMPNASNVANAAAEANPNLDLGTSLGGQSAPDIHLENQFGQPMSLSQFRGKVILLAFADSQCTTVCPLTTESMVLARELLGKAGQNVQLLGVDANPQATAVADVMAYSRVHSMVNQWDFLTGSLPQLKAAWSGYHIAVEIQQGLIDHTPALYVIDQRGKLQKIYLTAMAYSSVGQSAQVLAEEISGLLPGHPKLASQQSLATITPQSPAAHVSLAEATGNGTVPLAPGKPRLVVFFATWLSETSDLKTELTGLNDYARYAAAHHLPGLTAVDETVTEPSVSVVRSYLGSVGTLDYPVALDQSGRVADGYGAQDQPWLTLVSASGKVVWSHDGWVPDATLEKTVAAHS